MDDEKSPYIVNDEMPLMNDNNIGEPPRYSVIENTYSYVKGNQRFIFTMLIAIIIIYLLYYHTDITAVNGFFGSQKEKTLNDRISNLNDTQNRNLQYIYLQ
jgi:hypothetical protein